ncbi:MAG TPA: substrate-binding domain-containing protein [Rariglobus sp.]|nr:substrate-binding domain-containing protein [Rariglobus sp.]
MSFGRLVNEADTRLREWLDAAAHKPGTRLPSERALAAQLGIQHYALNRAMSRLITEGRVVREGYKLFVSKPAQTVVTDSCNLVVAQRSMHLASYRRVAKEMGIKLKLHLWESTEEALLMLDRLDSRDTEVVLFDPPYGTPGTAWEPTVLRLTKHGIPVVCIGQPSQELPCVLTDNTQALHLAVRHLVDLGHREIGFVTAPPVSPMAIEVVDMWNDSCHSHHLRKSSRRIYFQNNIRLKDEAVEVADLLVKDWSDATALIVFSGLDYNIHQLQEQLIQKGRRIPQDLSLLFIGGSKSLLSASPAITTVNHDISVMQEAAFHLAQRAMRKTKALGLLPPPCSLRIQPRLNVRESTRLLELPEPKSTKSIQRGITRSAEALPPSNILPGSTENLQASLRKPYPLAAKASLAEKPPFSSIELQPYVNRPLNYRRGWLGDLPLRNFPPGIHEIHGVPFQILGGSKRSDCGAVVFHSAVNATGSSQKLPDSISLPIRERVKAVYILHGCGYAKTLQTFAHYDFISRKKRLARIPIVSLGYSQPGHHPAHPGTEEPTPNIQDWWPDFPHGDFPHARMAPLAEDDGVGHQPHHVYLYTLEWINPEPDKIVDRLEITVDPDVSTTLGVLAATMIKA